MPKTLAQDRYTFEDFCFLVKDGQKADLIDGVIYMASPESIDGHRLFKWLYTLLNDYVEEKGLGCQHNAHRRNHTLTTTAFGLTGTAAKAS